MVYLYPLPRTNFVWIFIFIDITQLNDYSYIRDKTQFLISIKDQNPLWTIIFFIYYNLDLLLDFATPISLISGFIFGKYFEL